MCGEGQSRKFLWVEANTCHRQTTQANSQKSLPVYNLVNVKWAKVRHRLRWLHIVVEPLHLSPINFGLHALSYIKVSPLKAHHLILLWLSIFCPAVLRISQIFETVFKFEQLSFRFLIVEPTMDSNMMRPLKY